MFNPYVDESLGTASADSDSCVSRDRVFRRCVSPFLYVSVYMPSLFHHRPSTASRWCMFRIKNNQLRVHAGKESRRALIVQMNFKFVQSLSLA
jgi:hypothetical protein